MRKSIRIKEKEICIVSDDEDELDENHILLNPQEIKTPIFEETELQHDFSKFSISTHKIFIGSTPFECNRLTATKEYFTFSFPYDYSDDAKIAKIEISTSDLLKIIFVKDLPTPIIAVFVTNTFSEKLNKSFRKQIFQKFENLTTKMKYIVLFECAQSPVEFINCLKPFENSEFDFEIKEATDQEKLLIQRVCRTGRRKVGGSEDFCVLTYPDSQRSQICIYLKDLLNLKPESFVNDIIIDFYLSYIYHEKLNEAQKSSVYFFNSFFYSKLKTTFHRRTGVSATDFSRWVQKLSIFSYEYLVLPLNENSHWMVAVVCIGTLCSHTHKILNLPDISATPHNDELPCIYLFDSIGTYESSHIFDVIRSFVAWMIQRSLKISESEFVSYSLKKMLDHKSFPGYTPKLPSQNNFYDCGMFLLHYVEKYFTERPNVEKNSMNWRNWFDPNDLKNKREIICDLILSLSLGNN